MTSAQQFRIEVGTAAPETIMTAEPEGYVGVDGEIVDGNNAVIFDTAHLSEIGLMMMECLAKNGGTMGNRYFRPVLLND